jgi:hypothetical protein
LYTFSVRIDCTIRSHFEGAPTEADIVRLVTDMVNDGIEEHLSAGSHIVVAVTDGATPV